MGVWKVKTRFSKSALVAELRKREQVIRANQKFDSGNGTNQLRPANARESELIDRAVEYGRYRLFEQLADDIEAGIFP